MAAPSASPRKRRREVILDVALDLFNQHGFHGAGINEVGAAAGISGPGLYRHFASKDELLTEIFDRAWRRLAPPLWIEEELDARERLRWLVESHIGLAVEEAGVVQLWVTEQRHLPPTYLKRSQANFARYVEVWADALRELRPELSVDESTAVCAAVIGMINTSASGMAPFKADLRRRVLRGAALQSLHAPLDLEPAPLRVDEPDRER